MMTLLKPCKLVIGVVALLVSSMSFSQHYLEIQRRQKEESKRLLDIQTELLRKDYERGGVDCEKSPKNPKCPTILPDLFEDGSFKSPEEIALEKRNAINYKTEIVQRCGMSENQGVEIIAMKNDENYYSSYRSYLPADWRGVWIATYKIKTNAVVFGNQGFEYKYCVINAANGKSIFLNDLR